MGKNQHSKDRLFITATEWKRDYGGKNSAAQSRARPVPFDCCGLSFLPFVDPVCTPDGAVFDIVNIVRYIQKHHKHPNTGARLEVGSLTKLHYHKNAEGKYHCPITFKVFGDHTHIVAIRTSGNVYSYDAVKELNIKARNWTDLLTSQSFDRKTDVITLQDPNNRRIVSVVVDQSWVKGSLKVERAEKKKEKKASKEAVLARAKKAAEAVARSDLMNPENEKRIRFTTNRVAGAFTSTGVEVASTSEERPLSQEEKDAARWKAIKKLKRKGYVSLRTNLGDINLEVDCDIVPQTAENFLGLAAKGYYDGTIFHRNIRNFMLQGGDPTGTGKGGESLWGGKFKDEFTNQVSHNGRGILSMANAGKNTNGSQFFITYKSCQHLDNKHAIFGRVVGGTDVLRALELVPTDEDDRPKKEIKILKAAVFENPVKDYDEGVTEAAASSLAAQKAARKRKAAGGGGGGADDAPEPALKTEQIVVKVNGEWVVKTQVVPTAKALEDGVVPTPAAARGVGRYLKLPADAAAEKKKKKKQKKKEAAAAAAAAAATAAAAAAAAAARPAEAAPSHYKPKFKKTRTQFGNFSGW